MQRSEEGRGPHGMSPLPPEGPASRPAFWFYSPARVGSCWLQWPGFSAPGGAASASAAPRLGRKSGQLRSHLLCQPQQPDHPVAPTELNVSTVRWLGAHPHSAQQGPSPAALGDGAGKPGLCLVCELSSGPVVPWGPPIRERRVWGACQNRRVVEPVPVCQVLLFEIWSNLFPVSSL